jgi:hypothetical protein
MSVASIFTEKQVVGIWQDSLQGRADLKTIDDEPVRVIYPGRRNDDRGADFKDAIIATSQRQSKGDIEIHVKTSDWRSHRHHLNPAYNRVILHVVYQHDTRQTITLENGFTVPTLALRGYIGNDNDTCPPSPIPCRGIGYSGDAGLIGDLLDEAGEARFLARLVSYRQMILQLEAGQALYQAIMTALGYSKNKETMAELSRLMPLAKVEASASEGISDAAYLARCQAGLLGAAGLLPSQRAGQYSGDRFSEDWEERLENIWAALGKPKSMSAEDWHFFKIRPGNYPPRRIAAMSCLLLRYRHLGLLAGLEEKTKQVLEDNDGNALEEGLLVTADEFRGYYSDFSTPSSDIAPALLGKERAADIVINVLLPFFYARRMAADGEKALNIYREYRASAENTLVKHMRQQLGITRGLVNTARRQQGLIHIYQSFCLEGKCGQCLLGEP